MSAMTKHLHGPQKKSLFLQTFMILVLWRDGHECVFSNPIPFPRKRAYHDMPFKGHITYCMNVEIH